MRLSETQRRVLAAIPVGLAEAVTLSAIDDALDRDYASRMDALERVVAALYERGSIRRTGGFYFYRPRA